MRTRTKIVEDENEKKKKPNRTYIGGSHSTSSGPRPRSPVCIHILCMKCVYKFSYLLHSAFGFPCLPSIPTVYISCNGRCRRTYKSADILSVQCGMNIRCRLYAFSRPLHHQQQQRPTKKNASRILHSREHSDWARNTTYIDCAGQKRDNVDVGDMESGAKGHSEDTASVCTGNEKKGNQRMRLVDR